ncbi:hypothetical protein ES703_121321 [subsurface metagenome]
MRCDLCFKEKGQLQAIHPKCEARVCKGCWYDCDRIIGFLEHYGIGILIQGALELPKSKSKAKKTKSHPPSTTDT